MRSSLFLWLAFGGFWVQFFIERSRIDIMLSYLLNKSKYKKIKRGQSFIEWLLFTRYKNILPPSVLYRYYLFPLFLFVVTIATTILIDLSCDNELFYKVPFACQISLCALLNFIDSVTWAGWWKYKIRPNPEKILKRKGRNKK